MSRDKSRGSDREPAPGDARDEWLDEEATTRASPSAETVTLASAPAHGMAQTRRAQLTVTSGPHIGRAYSLTDGQTMLGRGKESDIVIDDAGASRRHARVVAPGDGAYWIEDLDSRNGTFIDGEKVKRRELRSGDRIHLGPNVTLSFAVLDAQAERIGHQLYETSVLDALTRVHNRRYLIDRLAREIAFARRHKTPLSVIIFDIDHFKRVNDTLGHLGGDEVLREVAALVSRMIRAEDVFARYGGEEFVVLARDVAHEGAGRFAERLRVGIEKLEVPYEATVVKVTISLGFASLSELSEAQRTVEGLLRLADARLYMAKSQGRNRSIGT